MLRFHSFARDIGLLTVLIPLVIPGAGCSNNATGGNGGTTGAAGGSGTTSTGATDKTPPTVVSSVPADGGVDEATTTPISATFSKAMAPLSLDATSFVVTQGATPIPGKLSYFNDTASFIPTADLALDTSYSVTITTAAKDLAGNPLAMNYVWSFKTSATAPIGPAPVNLGAASNLAILAKSAISDVPTCVVTGNVGLSPAAATYITGFALTKAGTKWTSPQVTGSIFAADNDPPTPTDLTTAVNDMLTAYTDAAGRPTPTALDLGGGTIGGLTFAPGLYKWTSSVTIPTDITISGAPNDTWIFQVSGDLTLSAAKAITLTGGARARNIVWQVAGAVDLGTTSHTEGVILSKTAIKMETGASINGRLYAQTAVSLASATVTVPAP
jgi:hypothetical protein